MEKIVEIGKIGTAVETLRISTLLNDHATSLQWQNMRTFMCYRQAGDSVHKEKFEM